MPAWSAFRRVSSLLTLAAAILSAACGGGGGGGSTSYAIGGTVSGLLGTLVIQNNGADDLSLSNNGSFSFASPIAAGGAYAVTVRTQPAGQACVVTNGAGTANAAVTQVTVTCTSAQTPVGGSVSGLSGTVVVQNNGSDDLILSADGAFRFATPIATGAAYTVTVLTQPAGQTCIVVNASGTATAPVTDVGISCTVAGTLTLFAGDMRGFGNVDGTGPAARFSFPASVAVDSAGNVYGTDYIHHTIRKITPAGVVSTFAGKAGAAGNVDAQGAAARFNVPGALAIDRADNLYVADLFNAAIRKVTAAGVVSTFAAPTKLGNHNSLTVDSAGNVYVGDDVNTIRRITPNGTQSTFAGSEGVAGSTDGAAAAALFNAPGGLATDSAGNVYVADTNNHTIRKITVGGTVATLAGSAGLFGSTDGAGAAARFTFPYGVATDSAGFVYVVDVNNTVRQITPAGVVSTLAGSASFVGSADGTGSAARFNALGGVATDSTGNIFVGDTFNHTIRRVTQAGVVSTLAGAAGVTGGTDGAGAAARFRSPSGLANDGSGNIYVADTVNHTIRRMTPAGTVSTLAGLAGTSPGSVDGLGPAARFNFPSGVATDGAGNVYVADGNNSTVRKVTPAGLVITLAGSAGQRGSADGAGAAARFSSPSAVAVDGTGNVFVVDGLNNTIRRITPAGVVSTFAGAAGVFGSADGVGAAASFWAPSGLAIDGLGNLYVVDSGNYTVRKITPAGVVGTLAGAAGLRGSADGIGAAARFQSPGNVTLDSAGNAYVTDGNHTVRKITPAGAVSTFAGTSFQAGFAPGPMPGLLSFPSGLAASGGSLYVTMSNGVARIQPVP